MKNYWYHVKAKHDIMMISATSIVALKRKLNSDLWDIKREDTQIDVTKYKRGRK